MSLETAPAVTSTAWHALDADAALRATGSGRAGLTAEEAAERLARGGPNAIPRPAGESIATLGLRQLASPLVWVLVAAAALAVALGRGTDAAVVLAVVVLNSIIGFVQEYRAGKAVNALLEMEAAHAVVVRAGDVQRLAADALVQGDVIVLAAGDKVPADARVLEARELNVDESALTGESAPVPKGVSPVPDGVGLGDRTSMLHAGTLATSGAGSAVVVSTGANTELGRISQLMRQGVDLETPLTRALARLGYQLTRAILLVAAILWVVTVARSVRGGATWAHTIAEAGMVALTLAVAAIPEGLPAIVTIALAIGVQRMAARRAIVRRLAATETLGSTTVICTDKTGTLTRNEMTVRELWTPTGRYGVEGAGYAPEGRFLVDGQVVAVPGDVRSLLQMSILCNDAHLSHDRNGRWRIEGDPTEGALVVAARKAGLDIVDERTAAPRLDHFPFDSRRQFMATLHVREGRGVIVMKGAPEVVLARCTRAAGQDEQAAQIEVEYLAARGMRVLAVATKEWDTSHPMERGLDEGFRLAGLVGIADPPRPEATEAIRKCRGAGIGVKMITGDHPATALSIAQEMGLASTGGVLTGMRLGEMTDRELVSAASDNDVFARVSPEQKLRLVQALQSSGHVVAMTGDGVNDAPALRQADIGVSMGLAGTAVAREASDLVLADDNFATIAAAVEEGRRVWQNLMRSLAFVLPTNLGLALVLGFSILLLPLDRFGVPLMPLEPVQILWINLIGAVALSIPLAFEPGERDAMRRAPRRVGTPILTRPALGRMIVAAVLMTVAAVGSFLWEYHRYISSGALVETALREAQSIALTAVVCFQIYLMLICRSGGSLRDNPTVPAGISVVVALHALLLYWPPLNAMFKTAPLELYDVCIAALAAAPILLVSLVDRQLGAARGAG